MRGMCSAGDLRLRATWRITWRSRTHAHVCLHWNFQWKTRIVTREVDNAQSPNSFDVHIHILHRRFHHLGPMEPPFPPSWPDGTADGADNYYLLGRGCDRIMIRPPIMPISRIMTSTNGLLNGPNTSTLSLEILLFIVNSAGPVRSHQALRRKKKDQRKKFTKMFNTYLPHRLIFLLGVVFHQH